MEPGLTPNAPEQKPDVAPEAAPGAASAQHVNPAAQVVPPAPDASTAAWPPAPDQAARASAAAAKPKGKGKGWIVGLAAVVMMGVVCLFGIQSCSSSLDLFSALYDDPSSAVKVTQESVGVIELNGTIGYDDSACSPEGFKKLLDKAAEDENVKAVVIRVNSGGGTATAGEEMTAYLTRFKEQTGKPVVVSCAAICASAAYEISSQADCIYAARSSAVGSIGTIIQVTNYAELLDKLGIGVENISSAKSKDSSYGTRDLSKEEREQYQHQVDQITDNFIKVVADGRKMSQKKVRKLATGMTYTGIDCVENGLVDAIGTRTDAVDKAAELAGCQDLEEVDLQGRTEDWSSLMELLGSSKKGGTEAVAAFEEFKQ
ncbi:MAG: signal peptide peptidase SppA [Coriobacteriia bacterium]|nr:signal peptide peptidase SppA [Coriobacteriia bacterium]